MKHYTRQDIRKLKPCAAYTDERIDELWGERDTLSAREIAALKIPAKDRFWALTRLMTDPTRSIARRIWCDQYDIESLPPVAKRWLETGDETIRLGAVWAATAAAVEVRACVPVAWAAGAATAAEAAWAAAWAASAAASDYEKYLEWIVEFMEAEV